MIIRTSIREPMALPKGDESHLLVQESNDKKLGRIVTRQCSSRVTYQLSINMKGSKTKENMITPEDVADEVAEIVRESVLTFINALREETSDKKLPLQLMNLNKIGIY